jgi:hypothetical protein
MNMKNLNPLYVLLLWISAFTACTGNSDYIYESQQDNIYFNFEDSRNNRILFSFADTSLDVVEITLFLPVKISGNRLPINRNFRIELIDSLTTAKAGLHYAPLADKYTLPADSGTFQLPITLYNTDDILQDSTLVLSVRLVESEDFSIGFPRSISANIVFSSRLEEPDWWKYWVSELGLYSRAKHYFFLISSGTKALHNPAGTDGYMFTPKALYNISEYKAFLNDPFSWVEKNPSFALEEQTDGTFLFYLKVMPEKTYQLVWESAIGKYYFIDENGEYIFL